MKNKTLEINFNTPFQGLMFWGHSDPRPNGLGYTNMPLWGLMAVAGLINNKVQPFN